MRVLVTVCAACVAAAPALGQTQWRLASEPVFTVGQLDGPPQALFSRIAGAIRLHDGRFVVADDREHRLSVFDAAGRLQTVFGREGEGPGEFRMLRAIWGVGGDTIGVWDSRLQRVTRFLADGTVIRTMPLRFEPGGPAVPSGSPLDAFLGSFADGRIALTWIEFGQRAPNQLQSDVMTFGVFSAEGEYLGVLGEQTGMQRVYMPDVAGGPFAFSPFPWATVVRDTLIYTNGHAGEVRFFDADPVETRADRVLSVPGPTMSLDDAWQTLEPTLEQSDVPAPFLRLIRSTDHSVGEVPRFARMFADDRGQLWLKEFDVATDPVPLRSSRFVAGGQWRIINTDGRTIARITMPDDVSPLAVYNDTLLGISRDTLDVERFVVYHIIR